MKPIVALLIAGVVSTSSLVSAKTPPKRPVKAAKASPAPRTPIDKRDGGLRRALADKTQTQFSVLIKFTHAVTSDQLAPLVLSIKRDLATGHVTRAQIDALIARDDVMSVQLLAQPELNAPT